MLTNTAVTSSNYFHKYVLNLLLERRFGLNQGANATVVAAYQEAAGALTDLAIFLQSQAKCLDTTGTVDASQLDPVR